VLRDDGPLDPATTVSLLRQAGLALAEAHRVGMVHRDVKPGNILVRPDGRVKITDFGIAWSAGSVPLTRTGQVIGTPQYLSPEQAEGRLASPASDVYALGLVGYECLAGHSAFDGDNAVTIALKQLREQPEPLPATLPDGLRALIERSLVKDPGQRLTDGSAFVAALDAAAAGRPLPGPAPAAATAAAAPAPRRPLAEPHPSGPVRVPPARRSWGRRTAPVLVPVLALFVGAAAAALVLLGVLSDQRPPGTAAAVAADTRGGSGVTLVAADYVGHPVDEVAAQLTGLGLTVQRQQDPTSDVAPDTVTRIDPAGVVLRKGDPVRVSYAVPLGYAPTSARAPHTEVSTRSTSQAAVASTSVAPVTEASPAAGTTVATRTAPTSTTSAAPTTTTSTTPPTETSSESPSPSATETSTASTSTPSGGGTG